MDSNRSNADSAAPAIELTVMKHGINDASRDERVRITDLIIAGFTGRDEQAVEAHITELEEIGVKRPATVPVFYRVAPANLTHETHATVLGEQTSGEVEFVIFNLEDGVWVGVGSDHTDRDVEAKYNVAASKQVCVKPVARELWRYSDISDHWDELNLSAWATIEGERVLYQQGSVSDMMTPDDLIVKHQAHFGDIVPGSVIFCGTFAVPGGPRPASKFEFELFDPVLDRRIGHAYTIHALPVRE